MVRMAAIVGCAGLLAACSSPEEMGEGIAAPQGESVQEALERRVAADAEPVNFVDREEVENGGREFSYAWPAQVSAIPALASELEERRSAALAEQKTFWNETLESCPPDGIACRNASFELEWQVVADLPNYLSLSSSFYTYTGGAHGNYGRNSLVWDREAGRALEPLALFASPAALETAIGTPACEALNRERAERRGEPVNVEAGGWFNECVSMEETVLFIGSSDGATFDRLGVYYGPYVAGPYAEGEFEFTLPVTRAVIDAVKPEYREAFSVTR
jgi:hypothetical protein